MQSPPSTPPPFRPHFSHAGPSSPTEGNASPPRSPVRAAHAALTPPPTPRRKTPTRGGWQAVEETAQGAHSLGSPGKVQAYIENRFPPQILEDIRQFGAIVIFGGRVAVEEWTRDHGYRNPRTYQGKSSSADVRLYQVPTGPKVIIGDIPSHAKYFNLCALLKHAGIDPQVSVVCEGTPTKNYADAVQALGQLLQGGSHRDVRKVVVFGKPLRVMLDLYRMFRPRDNHRGPHGERWARMQAAMGAVEHNIGTLRFFSVKIGIREAGDVEPARLYSLFCPNGEMTYHIAKTLLEAGATEMAWVGAGGAFDPAIPVGSYVITPHATLMDGTAQPHSWQLDRAHLLALQQPPGLNLVDNPQHRHFTVPSVLSETEAMVTKAIADGMLSGDVEMAHLLQAIDEHLTDPAPAPLRVLPGLFISDNPNAGKPLHQKINKTNCYEGLRPLLIAFFTSAGLVEAPPQGARRRLAMPQQAPAPAAAQQPDPWPALPRQAPPPARRPQPRAAAQRPPADRWEAFGARRRAAAKQPRAAAAPPRQGRNQGQQRRRPPRGNPWGRGGF